MNAIETALDWNEVSARLLKDLKDVDFNLDLRKMYNNIESMVTELSKMEVNARRVQRYSFVESRVNEINKSIDHLDKLILIARLMK